MNVTAQSLKIVWLALEKISLQSPWQSFTWRPHSAEQKQAEIPVGELSGDLICVQGPFELGLYKDETEGYYLNCVSPEPSVWMSLREQEDDAADAAPKIAYATVSYHEAARWMDGGEKVERIALPPELAHWLGEWTQANYKPPEKKKRLRPNSFVSKDGLYGDSMRNSVNEQVALTKKIRGDAE
jgi:hypothetical protein